MSSSDEVVSVPLADGGGRAITLRAVLLGLLGVVLICALTPYNDWAVSNTYFVGNYLPIGLLLFFLAFIMLVNGPLSRWRPGAAFSSGELSVALGMMLVGCAVPSSGLMRYLPATLVGVNYQPGVLPDFARVMRELDLPEWIFPTLSSHHVVARANDPVIQYYWNRAPGAGGGLLSQIAAVPWWSWLMPALTWGLFIAAFWCAILSIAVIVRRQWAENERLPFPLAQIYLSLIEPPERGRMLNTLFRARGFWVAAGAVFVIHCLNAFSVYDAKHWPAISLGFDLTSILRDPPWSFTEPNNPVDYGFRKAIIYFSIVGVTFFLQTKVAFSLWFFYVFFQAERIIYGMWQADFGFGAQQDQQVGSMIPFALAMLWVGRQQWIDVLRQMVGRTGDDRGRYLPYGVAGWMLAGSLLLMAGWLVAAGASVIGAVVLVLLIVMVMTVVARVVAETGLLFVQVGFPYWRPWVELLPLGIRTTPRSFFYHGLMSMIVGHDTREVLSVYSTHALRVADDASPSPRRAGAFIGVLALSLGVAFVVSGVSFLTVEYNHGVTLDQRQETPLNPWATDAGPKSYIFQPAQSYLPPSKGPREPHSRLGQFSLGFGITSICSVLRLRYAWWPLHPVGYLMAYGWPIKNIWFSIFVGWLIKLLVVRFGGMDLFRWARNIFIGLIIGEAGAAGLWLMVSLVRNALGMQYYMIRLLPN